MNFLFLLATILWRFRIIESGNLPENLIIGFLMLEHVNWNFTTYVYELPPAETMEYQTMEYNDRHDQTMYRPYDKIGVITIMDISPQYVSCGRITIPKPIWLCDLQSCKKPPPEQSEVELAEQRPEAEEEAELPPADAEGKEAECTNTSESTKKKHEEVCCDQVPDEKHGLECKYRNNKTFLSSKSTQQKIANKERKLKCPQSAMFNQTRKHLALQCDPDISICLERNISQQLRQERIKKVFAKGSQVET